MTLLELQILFHQKIEDVNAVFAVEQRPDSYTVVGYLNRAIMDYLRRTFLGLSTFEEQLIAIDANSENLRYLIQSEKQLMYHKDMTSQNWGVRAQKRRLPEDFLLPLSVTVTTNRTEVAAHSDYQQFAKLTTRRQAEKLMRTPSDRVIHIQPVAFIEDEFYIVVVGDSYVTSIVLSSLNYIRKPDKLSFEYAELTGGSASLDISSIPAGVYMRALSYLRYVNSAGSTVNFNPGDKVLKISGYNTIFSIDSEPVKIGHPWGYTDTPDFPEYMHQDILERAIQMFLDESKLKLVAQQKTV
ncbi:MAG: hypothetical protein HC876_22070 [Chloroflexaceae bacterium]|nr:hypothetical protein [Chloroflexaceae bacterium]